MNLATRWNPLYWQCACLCVNAGNYVGDMGTDDEEESVLTEDENEITDDSQSQSLSDDEKKDRRVAPNYGKIAKAIADAQLSGVNIELPDINESQVDFIPDIKNNSILYSLQAINVVGPDLLNRILNNRPFSSVEDFVTKVAPTQAQMLGLIKAGCFDKLYDIPRTAIINKYLQWVADQMFPLKDKLTSVQLKKALELGLQLPDYAKEIRIFKYKRYLDAKQSDKANKRYVLTEEACIKFFHSFIEQDLNIAKDEYGYLPNNAIFIKMSAFKRVYDKMLESLMEYINTEEGRKAYQDLLKTDYINSIKDKYCVGSTSKWEMDTMCFYHGDHELKNMLNSAYNTRNFNDLPESPEGQKPCTIAGTITDIDNVRHTISILTNYGIVDVKFYAGLYTQFNQKISVIDPDTKKKTVIDDSWFKRGNKLLIHGVRRENMFCCKQDRSSGYTRSVGLIEKVNYDGSLDIRYSRNKK